MPIWKPNYLQMPVFAGGWCSGREGHGDVHTTAVTKGLISGLHPQESENLNGPSQQEHRNALLLWEVAKSKVFSQRSEWPAKSNINLKINFTCPVKDFGRCSPFTPRKTHDWSQQISASTGIMTVPRPYLKEEQLYKRGISQHKFWLRPGPAMQDRCTFSIKLFRQPLASIHGLSDGLVYLHETIDEHSPR